ncbi:YecA family protein [Flavobacterium sp. W20_MBD1_R3]|uniref:YecA family protein n=1 Tax=Flavobacterium sp. W20_MBD1_R3 TaxID=3240278 RepID=UPI003F90DF27
MKKTGRNDKCPCGSEKKYKNCCLKKSSKTEVTKAIFPSVYQLITYKFFEEGHIDIDKELNKYENEIFNSISDLTKSSSDILKDYINYTEKLIKKIASEHSTYELLFWSRRLGPKNIFDIAELSVMLYREVQSLSFYKYGISEENIIIDETFSVFPKSIEAYNKLEYTVILEKLRNENLPESIYTVISDVIRIEILSFIYIKGTQSYRIANKGCEIVFDDINKLILPKINKDIGFLIDMYDERLSNTNLFSRTGSYLANTLNKENPYFCPLFQLNVDHKEKTKIINFKNEAYLKIFTKEDNIINIETNYLFGALNIDNIYNFLKLFEEEFYEYYSFSVIDFILFLGYLGQKIIIDSSQSLDSQCQILNRAYIIAKFNITTFSEDFDKTYPNLHKMIFKTEIDHKIDTIKILKRFLLEKDNKNDIDLWTRGPKRFLYQLSNDFMVVDYTGLTDIISFVVKEITSVDGDVGNRRAIYFEDSLNSEIESVYSKEKMWVCRNEITSGKLKKEIDASLIIGDVLFLIEAKAVNVSFGFDKGDKLAVTYRTNKMKSALKEINEKAEFIHKNKKNLNPKLPEGIRYLCPIVVSSNPEYIWSLEEELFISKELKFPRIMVIPDIAKLKGLDLTELKKKKWLINL